jgi:hypothetical protein
MANDMQALTDRLAAALAECAAWQTTVDALVRIVVDRPIELILAASPRREG